MIMRVAVCLCLLAAGCSAGAGDCWVESVENKTTGFGEATGAERYAGFRRALRRADGVMQGDPAINAIPGVRFQSHRYIGVPYRPGAPLTGQVSVYLHMPDVWEGKCGLRRGADIVHFAELNLNFNDLRTLLDLGVEGAETESGYYHAPRRIGARDGYPVFENASGNHVLVMTAGSIPAFAPVTVGEYLDYWNGILKAERDATGAEMRDLSADGEWKRYIADLRRSDPAAADEMQKSVDAAALQGRDGNPEIDAEWNELQRLRSTLSVSDRSRPAYLTASALERYRFGYAREGDDGATALIKLNSALWAGRPAESDVRVVTLEVLMQDGKKGRQAGVDRWLAQVDLRPYLGLLGRGVK